MSATILWFFRNLETLILSSIILLCILFGRRKETYMMYIYCGFGG